MLRVAAYTDMQQAVNLEIFGRFAAEGIGLKCLTRVEVHMPRTRRAVVLSGPVPGNPNGGVPASRR